MRDGAKHSEAEVDRGNMTSKRLVSWRSLNPRSLPPLGFSHFTRSPHGVSEVRHEPREGREVGAGRVTRRVVSRGRLGGSTSLTPAPHSSHSPSARRASGS